MDNTKLVADKEEQELLNKWIEKKMWQRANIKYPNDTDKANQYFTYLMNDTAELAELQSEYKNKIDLNSK